jgi:predicted nucleic acid-binding protein
MRHDQSHLVLDVLSASALLERVAPEGIAISIVTYMEAFQGIYHSPDPHKAREKFETFLIGVLILPFSFAVAERCARLRETLKSQNKRVNSRALDLIIAATALEYGLTLITKNTEDFKDIPDLSLYQPHAGAL